MHVCRNMSETVVHLEEHALYGDDGGILWRDWSKQSEQRGVKLAVTEKMRIRRQGDKEFKQNEACRLAALPSVTGVISRGSLSLCLLPLYIM